MYMYEKQTDFVVDLKKKIISWLKQLDNLIVKVSTQKFA